MEEDLQWVKLIEKWATQIGSTIQAGIRQTNYHVYVYICGLSERDGALLTSISGDGETYVEACKDYAQKIYGKQLDYRGYLAILK